jgi:hypothetical protein
MIVIKIYCKVVIIATVKHLDKGKQKEFQTDPY